MQQGKRWKAIEKQIIVARLKYVKVVIRKKREQRIDKEEVQKQAQYLNMQIEEK